MRCDFNYIRLELYKNVFAMCFERICCWCGCVIVFISYELGVLFRVESERLLLYHLQDVDELL